MPRGSQEGRSQANTGWLEGHTPTSVPYIIGFSIFVPVVIGVNIGLEFWLGGAGHWAAKVRQGLLDAGTMSTWGIPLTIIATEVITRMLARHYIARKERALTVWHREQVAKWEERRRRAEADGKEFNEPAPEPPPGISANGQG